MIDIELWGKFCDYLDFSLDSEEKPVPTSELGLVKDAPQSAIDAYEEYKKLDEEAAKEGWE